MANIFDEFRELIHRLNVEGIEYAVCGGWAMAIHGVTRATIDIDLLVLTEDLDRAWKIAEEQGYSVEGLPLSFDSGLIEIRRISKIDAETKSLFTIDFLLVTDGLRDVWETREKIDWQDDQVFSVSRSGLKFMKRVSGRDKDLVDLRSLEELENEG
jgi:hypothetical protein